METWKNKEHYMLRKLLLVAAAIAMPVGAVAVSGGIASAAGPQAGKAISCAVASTVTFAAPGLSKAGSVSTAKTSTTKTGGLTFSGTGCSGSGAGHSITTAATKCTGAGKPSPYTACKTGDYGYDAWSGYISEGTSSIQKAIPTLAFTLNGNSFTATTSKVSDLSCKDSEVGFSITGKVTAPAAYKGATSTLSACLGKVTGTGLTSTTNFAKDINGPGTLKTATIDKTTSTIKIS
jgi:hypothetical protein